MSDIRNKHRTVSTSRGMDARRKVKKAAETPAKKPGRGSSAVMTLFGIILISATICLVMNPGKGVVGSIVSPSEVLSADALSSGDVPPADMQVVSEADTTAGTQTAASTTTSTSTTVETTAVDEQHTNAQYVSKPNYKSPYYIVVFTGTQTTVVYGKDSDGGYTKVITTLTCSTGASGSPTRTGLYHIRAKYRWRWLVGNVYGQYCSSISDSYLFHSVPYAKNGDHSSLDETGYNALGRPFSHGCIRMCIRDTKWIYDNCPIGTQVNIVNADGPKSGRAIPPLIDDATHDGWDPTDPDSANPYSRPSETSTTETTTTTAEPTTTSTTSGTAESTSAAETNGSVTEDSEPNAAYVGAIIKRGAILAP